MALSDGILNAQIDGEELPPIRGVGNLNAQARDLHSQEGTLIHGEGDPQPRKETPVHGAWFSLLIHASAPTVSWPE